MRVQRFPSVQLDRIPPPLQLVASPPANSGTPAPAVGVVPDVAAPRRMASGWQWLALVVLALCLLGQGERSTVDLRFATPTSTLFTYWEALRANDEWTLAQCMLDDSEDRPFAGMLWFMPPTRRIHLDHFHTLGVTGGRMVVTYQVRFRPTGTGRDLTFQTSNELVRDHGEWRIARGIGSASIPEWRAIPRPVVL